jgi:hypothetical protein
MAREPDGLYPYQRTFLDAIQASPTGRIFDSNRYRKPFMHPALGMPYGGKLSDYMVQMRSRPLYWIDDVFDRRLKRLEAYCMADVRYTEIIYANYAEVELRILMSLLCGYTVQSPHRRLKAPYGNDATGNRGTHISIQWRGATGIALGDGTVDPPWPTRRQADMIGGLTVGWGCPEFIAVKVAECMFGSGRYDCIVTVSEISLRNLDNALEQMGATVVVIRANYRNHRESEFK